MWTLFKSFKCVGIQSVIYSFMLLLPSIRLEKCTHYQMLRINLNTQKVKKHKSLLFVWIEQNFLVLFSERSLHECEHYFEYQIILHTLLAKVLGKKRFMSYVWRENVQKCLGMWVLLQKAQKENFDCEQDYSLHILLTNVKLFFQMSLN